MDRRCVTNKILKLDEMNEVEQLVDKLEESNLLFNCGVNLCCDLNSGSVSVPCAGPATYLKVTAFVGLGGLGAWIFWRLGRKSADK